MTRLIIAACMCIACSAAPVAWGQNCKPTVSTTDKITKTLVTEWGQGLYQTGLIGSTITGSAEINISGSFLRNGDTNAVNLILTKKESNIARAALESQYKADKGNEFSFGFKGGGTPLKFVADTVTTKTAADMFGNLDFRVILSAHLTPEQVIQIEEAITTKVIDAVRVSLSNQTIDKSIKDANAGQFLIKFFCFADSVYRDLESTAPKNNPAAKSISGKYVRKGKETDYAELFPDGTFTVRQDGKDYKGTYYVFTNSVIFRVTNMRATGVRIVGNALLDPGGIRWENPEAKADEAGQNAIPNDKIANKPPESKSDSSKQLTVEQIIKMVEAKVADDLIISTIQKSGSKFDLTPELLIKLKTSGVSDAVIRAMNQ